VRRGVEPRSGEERVCRVLEVGRNRSIYGGRALDPMTEPEGAKKGRFLTFWTTLPGVLTAIAALIAAIAGVVGLVVRPGGSSADSASTPSSNISTADPVGPTHDEFVRQANELCSQTADLIRALPQVDTSNFARIAPEYSRDLRSLVKKIRALDTPTADQATVERLVSKWEEETNDLDGAILAFQQGDDASFAASIQQIDSLDAETTTLAQSLGADACAQSPVPLGAS